MNIRLQALIWRVDAMPQTAEAEDRFARWAAILFAVLAGVTILVAIVVTAKADAPTLNKAIGLAQVAVAVALLFIAIWGLGVGAPWARPFAVVVLLLLVVEGALSFAGSLLKGNLNVPLLAIAALVVLGQRRRPVVPLPLAGRERSILTILVTLMIVQWTWGVILGPLLL